MRRRLAAAAARASGAHARRVGRRRGEDEYDQTWRKGGISRALSETARGSHTHAASDTPPAPATIPIDGRLFFFRILLRALRFVSRHFFSGVSISGLQLSAAPTLVVVCSARQTTTTGAARAAGSFSTKVRDVGSHRPPAQCRNRGGCGPLQASGTTLTPTPWCGAGGKRTVRAHVCVAPCVSHGSPRLACGRVCVVVLSTVPLSPVHSAGECESLASATDSTMSTKLCAL